MKRKPDKLLKETEYPKEVTLRYRDCIIKYEMLSCRETPRGVFCTVLKDGKKLEGVCLKSLLNSRFNDKV